MIELFVNNHEVVLPDDFEMTLIEENAEITSSGEYTLDITTSLLESKNAIAFSFINRLNNSNVGKTAVARLVDNGVVRNGIITIMDNTDIQVTHQFLAGNSELKYNDKNDGRKIWELEGWGEEEPIAFYQASRSIDYVGYGEHQLSWNSSFQNNYVCTPVLISGKILNEWTLYKLDGKTKIENVNNIVMQPYLLYYVEKLPSLIGYSLGENCLLENPSAKKMYLTNPIASLKYSDALPDMTVTEFIEAVQGLFNVTFKVNAATKIISIVKTISNLQNRKVVSPVVLDEYERDLSSDDKTTYRNGLNVGYAMNNSDKYFVYQKLSDDQLKNFTIIEGASMEELVTAAQAGPTDVKKWMTIFKNTTTGNYYYINDLYGTSFDRSTGFGYRFLYKGVYAAFILINKFRDIVTDPNSTKLELKICPAAMIGAEKNSYWNSNTGPTSIYYQLPKCSRNLEETPEAQNIFDVIEKGVNQLPRLDFIEVAFFTGKINVWEITDTIKDSFLYPFSHVDIYPEFYHYALSLPVWENWLMNVYSVAATETMRLYGTGGVIDSNYKNNAVDTSEIYLFTMIDNADVNVDNIFLINNLKYIPINFERRKSNKSTTVVGKLYRMF